MNTFTRRQFIKRSSIAAGSAALAFPFVGKVLGANDRIRLGIIGIGARGSEITQEAINCPNTQFVAFADIYTRNLEKGKRMQGVSPDAKTYLDYRYLLDDKSIDAVSIATPNFHHTLQTVWACQAGKDVYVEKPCRAQT